jgi:predicted nucleic-acid-binding protein
VICIDTNILVRYFVEGDTSQAVMARVFIEEQLTRASPGFITSITLIELIWVLQDRYNVPLQKIKELIGRLIHTKQFLLEHAEDIERALHVAHDDFADILIHEIGAKAGCAHTVTLDRKFARLKGVKLL